MIGRIETFLRRLRRRLSRSVWLARLLRLPVSAGSPNRPGLLMIQIDGLEAAPDAFIGLLTGKNLGKLVIRVGADELKV